MSNWISQATKNKGGLHKSLHMGMDKKIPHDKLMNAAHSDNEKLRRQAILAMTLSKLRKK